MCNILSYQPGTVFIGAEIKEWAKRTISSAKDENKRKIASWVWRHYSNLKDNQNYSFYGLRYRNTTARISQKFQCFMQYKRGYGGMVDTTDFYLSNIIRVPKGKLLE